MGKSYVATETTQLSIKGTVEDTNDKVGSVKSTGEDTNTKITSAKTTAEDTNTKVGSVKGTVEATQTTVNAVDGKADDILALLNKEQIFGFIEHCATLSPGSRIEYIGINRDYSPIVITKGGGYSLTSWADFPWLKENKPYMVKADGTADYALCETDYTKKADGVTASDVANTSYNGGAFAWAPKIYKMEYMLGDDRYVLFSMTERDGFEAVGFIDPNGNELDGVWIPMFYGSIVSSKMRSISGTQPDYGHTTAEQKTAIDAFGSRAKFFGGAIVETLIDLMIMFCKNTDLQDAYGYGNCNGYNSGGSPTYGVKANAVVGGGQFYGTSDKTSLNKVFHSIVLGTYQQYMRDPYTLLVSGAVKVSKNYSYDLTGAAYTAAGITFDSSSSGWEYPNKYVAVPGFGALPVRPCSGSTSTGGCDGLYVNVSDVRLGLRFGSCDNDLTAGPRCLNLLNVAAIAHWTIGAAVLLLPPASV